MTTHTKTPPTLLFCKHSRQAWSCTQQRSVYCFLKMFYRCLGWKYLIKNTLGPKTVPIQSVRPTHVYLTTDSPIWLKADWRRGLCQPAMAGQKWSPWRWVITAVKASSVLLAPVWFLSANNDRQAYHAPHQTTITSLLHLPDMQQSHDQHRPVMASQPRFNCFSFPLLFFQASSLGFPVSLSAPSLMRTAQKCKCYYMKLPL